MPRDEIVVTAHQPNYLPGLNVIEKVEAADIVIWLDRVQYTKGGWTNRNKMPDGSWLTVPLKHPQMVPINELQIDNTTDWHRTHCRTIRQHYGRPVEPFCRLIEQRFACLATLNIACLSLIMWNSTTWPYLQSEVDVKSGPTISEQLAAMVYALDGDVYLSGPSGRRYLDETPFLERGMIVRYQPDSARHECVLARYLERPIEA